jgi:NOL1/NOP2/fmu family ribosome biogenesis protein
MANDYNGYYPEIGLTEKQADDYLRMRPLHINTTLKGVVCFTFNNLRLGFGKILTDRVNNYYPKNLRIVKDNSYVPENNNL